MLGALRLAAPHRVPVLGVNLGTLGYLTEVDSDHLGDALSSLARGEFEVESRAGLVLSAPGVVDAQLAYNDVVLTRVFNRAVVLSDSETLVIKILSRSAPVSIERDGQLLGHAEGGTTFDVRVRPDVSWVLRVKPGGFAERARRKLGITDPAGLADFDMAGHER